jgi:hypothetical protein
MKYPFRQLLTGVLLVLGALVGCKVDPPASLYDPNYQNRPTPTISSIAPPGVALAAVTTITITGTNFSPDKTQNQVMFDATPGTILSASATQLTLVSPIMIKDSVKVRVTVMGATLFSNILYYRLDAAVLEFGVDTKSAEDPYGMDCDSAGNLYVSLVKNSDGSPLGVKKFTPSQVRTDYSPAAPGATKWSSLKVGPGGVLYAARQLNALYRIPAGGGTAALWTTPTLGGLGRVNDLDFDAAGNIWAAGNDTKICRVTSAGAVKTFPFTANVRSVRVFNGALYLGGTDGTIEAVWKGTIVSSDSLGPLTVYYDNSAHYAPQAAQVTAVTFSIDGNMYVGTDAAEGILIVTSTGGVSALYPGLMSPTPINFAWGKGTELYASRGGGTLNRILRINTLKQGAPTYGRQL